MTAIRPAWSSLRGSHYLLSQLKEPEHHRLQGAAGDRGNHLQLRPPQLHDNAATASPSSVVAALNPAAARLRAGAVEISLALPPGSLSVPISW